MMKRARSSNPPRQVYASREVYVKRARAAPRRRLRSDRVPRTLSSKPGFPPILFMRHAYHNTLSRTVAPVIGNNFTVNITNLSHPIEAVNDLREATFKDDVEGIYKNYMVVGARVEFDVVIQESNGAPLYVIAALDNDLVPTPYLNTLMTRPDVSYRLLTGDITDANARARIVMNYSMKKTYGRDAPIAKLQAESDSYLGPPDSNTTKCRLYMFQPTTPNSPETSVVCFVGVHIKYYVKWYNRGDITPSFYTAPAGAREETEQVAPPPEISA